jgi:hypothetical protein
VFTDRTFIEPKNTSPTSGSCIWSGGLTVPEIARAFLVSETTIDRANHPPAKAKIKTVRIRFGAVDGGSPGTRVRRPRRPFVIADQALSAR